MIKRIQLILILTFFAVQLPGQLVDAKQYTSGSSTTILFADLLDMNNDGIADYFYHSTDALFYKKGLGSGLFSEIIKFPSIFERNLLFIEDLNNDNLPDIAGFSSADQSIKLYMNEGQDDFVEEKHKIEIDGQIKGITSADLDNDGINEFYLSLYNGNQIIRVDIVDHQLVSRTVLNINRPEILRKSQKGQQGLYVHFDYDMIARLKWSDEDESLFIDSAFDCNGNLYSMYVTDLDQDDQEELLFTTQFRAYLREYLSDASFGNQISLGKATACWNMDVFDMDQDGDLDVLFPNYGEYHLTLIRQNGALTFDNIEVDFPYKNKFTSLVLDLEEDGSYEGLVDGKIYTNILTTPEEGGYVYERAIDYDRAMALDFTDDGINDLVIHEAVLDAFYFFRNMDGSFILENKIEHNYPNFSFQLTDFDQDGRMDLLYSVDKNIEWIKNTGNGFENPIVVGTIPGTSGWILRASGDLDGDNLEDLVLEKDNDLMWLKRSGNSYLNQMNLIFDKQDNQVRANGINIVDLDRDGYNDVVASDFYSTGVRVYVNQNGSFDGSSILLIDEYGTEDIEISDLNGDTFPDLIILDFNGNQYSSIRTFINQEDFSFSEIQPVSTNVRNGMDIQLGDINGDGLKDIVYPERMGDQLLIFYQLGNGLFTEAYITDFVEEPQYGYLEQLDQDDLPEYILIAGDTECFVYDTDGQFGDFLYQVSNKECNDNNTLLNTADDYLSFDLWFYNPENPFGNYRIYSLDGSLDSSGVSGAISRFSFEKGSAGLGDKELVVEDILSGKTSTFTIEDRDPCHFFSENPDLNGLMALWSDNNGPNWSGFNMHKWESVFNRYINGEDITPAEYCDLPGVICNDQERVTTLVLIEKKLKGVLSAGLGLIEQLDSIDFSKNELSGLSKEIGSLKNLRALNLLNNQLSGSLPDEIGEMENLEYLNLMVNNLDGPLPETIGNLSKLRILILNGGSNLSRKNKFPGPLPESFGNLESLESAIMHECAFSGTIPESLGNLKQLRYLNLGSNSFSGAIPESLGNLNKITHLILQKNQLTGPLPISLPGIINENFYICNLNYNQIGGCIPESYKDFCGLNFHIYTYPNIFNFLNFCNEGAHSCEEDYDGDGFIGSEDCNDLDPGIYPDAPEIDFNNVDENCDNELYLPCDDNVLEGKYGTFEEAAIICEKRKYSFYPQFTGTNPADASCFSDLEGDHGVSWFKVKILSPGSFTFNIEDPFKINNLDFVVYHTLDIEDESSLNEIRCMRAGSNEEPCKFSTGLSVLESDTSEGPGCGSENNHYLAAINAQEGDYYVIKVIYNRAEGDNLTIDFCGDAGFGSGDFSSCDTEFLKFDEDNDGYFSEEDCDDNNPAINPGAEEILYNDVDENCDGIKELACATQEEHHTFTYEQASVICTKDAFKQYLFDEYSPDKDLFNCNDYPPDPYNRYTAFYKIKIVEAGSFYFRIHPVDDVFNLNFMVFKAENDFEKESLEEIRCVISGSAQGECVGSYTGLAPWEEDFTETGGCPNGANGFAAAIDAEAGDEYVLMVHLGFGWGQFEIEWCGTATFLNDDSSCTDPFVSTQNTSLDRIKIHPNPAYDRLYFEGATEQIWTGKIVATDGKIVREFSSLKDNSLSVSELDPGIYFLHLTYRDGSRQYEKLILGN